MKTVNSVNWKLLLDGDRDVANLISQWSIENLTTRDVASRLAYTKFSGEFRKLVRANGTTYARRLARKALRYRGVTA